MGLLHIWEFCPGSQVNGSMHEPFKSRLSIPFSSMVFLDIIFVLKARHFEDTSLLWRISGLGFLCTKPPLLREKFHICVIPSSCLGWVLSVYLYVRLSLWLSYSSKCCPFIFCCGVSDHPVSRGNNSTCSYRFIVSMCSGSFYTALNISNHSPWNFHFNSKEYDWKIQTSILLLNKYLFFSYEHEIYSKLLIRCSHESRHIWLWHCYGTFQEGWPRILHSL